MDDTTLDLQVEDHSPSIADSDPRHSTDIDNYGRNTLIKQTKRLRKAPLVRGEFREAEMQRNNSSGDGEEMEDGGGDDTLPERSKHRGDDESLSCTCKKRCWKEFSAREQHQIYTGFWDLPSDTEKSDWLHRHVGRSCLNYGEERRQRGLYKTYWLPSNKSQSMVKVCSSFFKTTLGLSTPRLLQLLGGDDQEHQNVKSEWDMSNRTSGSTESFRAGRKISNSGRDGEQTISSLHGVTGNNSEDEDDDDDISPNASGANDDLSSVEITFDLGGEVAALFIKQAFMQQSRLLDEMREKQSAALILDKFNQTYPIHNMDMTHFLPVYRRVVRSLKRQAGASSRRTKTQFSGEVSDDEGGQMSDAESEGGSDKGYNSRPDSEEVRNIKRRVFKEDQGLTGRVKRRFIQTSSRTLKPIAKEGRAISQRLKAKCSVRSYSKLQTAGGRRDNPRRKTSMDSARQVDRHSENVEQKFQKAIRERVKRLKQYAINMQAKIQAKGLKGEEHFKSKSNSRMKASAVKGHKQAKSGSLRVLRFKHKHPLLPACKCTRRNCAVKIPEQRRRDIHETFWDLVGVQDRKEWLLSFVERLIPTENISTFFNRKKYVSKRYFLPDSQGERVEVCRLFFIHTLGFKWDSAIDNIVRSKLPVTYVAQTPRKRPPRWLPENIVQSVEEYILSVTNSEQAFEDCDLSSLKLKNLYLDYKEKHRSLKFNLGYQSFRRLCENSLCGRQQGDSMNTQSRRVATADAACQPDSPEVEDESMRIFREQMNLGKNVSSTKEKERFDTGFAKSEVKDKGTSTSQDLSPPGGKSDTNYCLLDMNSGFLKNMNSKASSTSQFMSLMDNRQDADTNTYNCAFGACEDILRTKSCSLSVHLQRPGKSGKRKKRPLSKLNDKTYHPVLPPCKCAKKCYEKLTEKQRQIINDKFWALPGYNERKQWMNIHIERYDVQTRKVKPSAAANKNFKKMESRTYFLPDMDGRQVGVCRTFFLSTLGYKWDSVIGTLTRTTGRDNRLVTPDMRGRGPPHHKISEDALVSVVKYSESVCILHRDLYKMKSLETLARFGRSDMLGTLRNYGLTVHQLFKDYKTKHADQKISYASFRRVFKRVHAAIVLSDCPHFEDINGLTSEMNANPGEGSSSVYDDGQDESYDGPSVNFDNSNLRGFNVGHGRDSDSDADLLDDNARDSDDSNLCMQKPVFPQDFHYKGKGRSYQHEPQNLRNITSHVSLPSSQMNISQGLNSASNFYLPRSTLEGGTANEPPMLYGDNLSMAGPSGFTSHFPSQQNPHFPSLQTKNTSDFQKHGLHPTHLVNPGNQDLLGPTLYQRGPLQYQSLLSQLTETEPRNDLASNSFQSCHGTSDTSLDLSNRLHDAFPTMDGLSQSYYNNPTQYGAHQPPHAPFPSFPNTHLSNSSHPPGIADQGGVPFGSFSSYVESCGAPANMSLHNPCFKADKMDHTKQTNIAHNKSSKEQSNSSKGKRPKSSTANTLSDCESEGRGEKKGGRGKCARNSPTTYPMLPPCSCTKLKCAEKFTEDARQKIHDMFWSLGSYNNRKQWLLLHIKRIEPKRRRVDCPETKRKGETRFYYLPRSKAAGDVVEVCKTFFLRTLGYRWDKIIDTIRRTTEKGDNVSTPDQRGRRTPAHKLSSVVTDSVTDYVKSMWQSAKMGGSMGSNRPVAMAGSSTDRSNISQSGSVQVPYGLTMKDLYNDYKTKHGDHKISIETFRRIYKTTDLNAPDGRGGGDFDNFLGLH